MLCFVCGARCEDSVPLLLCTERNVKISHGVVGWCEGVMYLMSQGRPADIDLQLGKACYPCKGKEVMFLFLLFLHFHSCSSFFPVPLFHLFCYLFCRFFSLSMGDYTK